MEVGRHLSPEDQLQLLEARGLVFITDQVAAQQFADLSVRLTPRPVQLAAGVPGEQVLHHLRHFTHHQGASVVLQHGRHLQKIAGQTEEP